MLTYKGRTLFVHAMVDEVSFWPDVRKLTNEGRTFFVHAMVDEVSFRPYV